MPTEDERNKAIKDASAAVSKCKTVDELRAVWQAHYTVVGHKILGRLLIGQSADDAGRRRGGATG